MTEFLAFSLLLVVGVSSVVGQCPTWFKETENGSCECGPELGGMIKCDNCGKDVSIVLAYCMTYDNSSGELLVGYANYGFRSGRDRAYNSLPKNVAVLNDIMCTNISRKGFLCGECMGTAGVAINSLFSECAECNVSYTVGMYILLVIVPITLFFIVVVMFRLNFTSGPFLGYIMFCQLFIAVVRKDYGLYQSLLHEMGAFGQTVVSIVISLSGIWWYSVSAFWWISPVCLSKHMTNLQVVCLQYIFVLYPLFLLIVTYVCIELHARDFRLMVYLWKPFHKCFAKVRRNWSTSDSIIHAYATFLFLSFSSLASVTYDLLWATNVYNINGTITRTVMILEPTMEWLSPKHLKYAIPAMTILFFLGFCPTLFLCLLSTRVFTKYIRFGPRMQLFLQTFADVFQSCYKDGLNGTWDFRFLSSAPMFGYLSIVLSIFVIGNQEENGWPLESTIAFAFSLGFAYVRPFKTLYMNFSFSFLFSVIGVTFGMSYLWYQDSSMSSYSLAVTWTLLYSLPHLLAFITALYYVLSWFHCTQAITQNCRHRLSVVAGHMAGYIRALLPNRNKDIPISHFLTYENIKLMCFTNNVMNQL